MEFRIERSVLEALLPTGAPAWRWTAPSGRVEEVLPVEGTGDVIVRTQPSLGLPRGTPSLFRIAADGRLRWTADYPDSSDGSYVAARLEGREVIANTWDGHCVTVDLETGRVKGSVFVK